MIRSGSFLLFFPLVVNGTFSIELTLKAILAKNDIEYEKEHNLMVLYKMLPDAFQKELLLYLNKKAPEYMESETFFDELLMLSNAFVDWRYAFEGKPVPAVDLHFLSAFSNAAIVTMFSHYNTDLQPSARTASDDEIEQMFRENREKCKEINFKKVQKKLKEHRL